MDTVTFGGRARPGRAYPGDEVQEVADDVGDRCGAVPRGCGLRGKSSPWVVSVARPPARDHHLAQGGVGGARRRAGTRQHAPGSRSEGFTPVDGVHRNLVAEVLQEQHLPERLAGSMPEDRVSEIADTLDELFGLRPSSWTLVRKTADTILHLAEIGNVIVIGRGANIITDRFADALHVRLVGSVRRRIEHIEEYRHLDPQAATEYVRRMDQGRKRYVTKYYEKDIDDPLTLPPRDQYRSCLVPGGSSTDRRCDVFASRRFHVDRGDRGPSCSRARSVDREVGSVGPPDGGRWSRAVSLFGDVRSARARACSIRPS